MRLTTKSSRSVSFITTSWLIVFGCLLDCLRGFSLTGSTGSAIGSTTVYAIILACALALYLALVLGATASRGAASVFRSRKDGALSISAGCGITAFVSIKIFSRLERYGNFRALSQYVNCCGSLSCLELLLAIVSVCNGSWLIT